MIETRRLKNVVIFFQTIILLCFFFLFLVTRNNDLFIPVPTVNIKVKEEPSIPTGIPSTAAYEAILNQMMLTKQ